LSAPRHAAPTAFVVIVEHGDDLSNVWVEVIVVTPPR
jgi:hypothetical protein